MEIKVKIDQSIQEPKVVIYTQQVTEEITELMKRLSVESPQVIAGFCNTEATLLQLAEIIRIYTADSKVYAETAKGEYQLRQRLYELEMKLDKKRFVRISNSEIINLKMVKNFDLSFTGTVCVSFISGGFTYVSRRYVSKIKQILGL